MLPYILDERHPADTWFLVFEQDHRFYKRDEIPVARWLNAVGRGKAHRADEAMEEAVQAEKNLEAGLQACGRPFRRPPKPDKGDKAEEGEEQGKGEGEEAGEEPTLSAAAPAEDPPKAAEASSDYMDRLGMPSAGFKRAYGTWEAGVQKDVRKKDSTPELRDLVVVATQAERVKHGDLVWYCWCGDTGRGGRNLVVSHGSMCIGLGKNAARQLRQVFQEVQPYHADLVIKKACETGKVKECSYVSPAVGSFATHKSAIIKGQRKSEFDAEWASEGVCPEYGDRPKKLMAFTTKGPLKVLKTLSFSNCRALWWKTFEPPRSIEELPNNVVYVLQRRGWMDPDTGEWWGPSKGKASGKSSSDDPFGVQKGKGGDGKKGVGKNKGKGKRACRGREYDLLRERPATRTNLSGEPSPVPLFVLEVAMDRGDWDYNGEYSRRVWDTRRHAQRLYQRRIFEEDPMEARATTCHSR